MSSHHTRPATFHASPQEAMQAPAEEIAAGLWADITEWAGDSPNHDDTTLLVLRGGEVAARPEHARFRLLWLP
mgnify:CR=1 FL=1